MAATDRLGGGHLVDPAMKSAGIALISALGLVASIVAYEALKPEPLRPPTTADVKVQIDALKAEATRRHPGMAQSDAMKQVAIRQARESLGTGDALNRSRNAAGIFFGAYFMNTRARPEYCRQRGVDLRPFVTAYEEVHRAELARARAVFLEAGMDPETLAPALQGQFVGMVEQDMKDFASGAQVPLENTCALFNENARAIAQAIELPAEVRQALSARP
jgi:hypothetical protein